MAEPNTIAEVLDTFFNGRPAPRRPLKPIRVRIPADGIQKLNDGQELQFRADGVEILVSTENRKAR